MDPRPEYDEQARKFKELLESPSTELWIWDIDLCLNREYTRHLQWEHLGNLAERYEDIIARTPDKNESRTTLARAIDDILEKHPPNSLGSDIVKSSMLLDLVSRFTPPSGFDWTERLLDALGMPKPETRPLIGGEDTHMQALHALESYFFTSPDISDESFDFATWKKTVKQEFSAKLPAYRTILQKYAESPTSYANYARRVLGELDTAFPPVV